MPYHRCEACHCPFESNRARDRFCPGCDTAIEQRTKEAQSLLDLSAETRKLEVSEETRGEFYEIFVCHIRRADGKECGWEGNRNRRSTTITPEILWESVEIYAIAYQKHIMRHLLPTHFPPCRRNLNEWTAEYWRKQNEIWGFKLGWSKARPPRGKPMATPPGSIERWQQMMTDEMQKAIPADCTSVEETEKAWKAYVERDWKARRAEGNGYVWVRNSDGREIPFGPDGASPHGVQAT